MVESLSSSCIDEPSISFADDIAQEMESCSAYDDCVGDSGEFLAEHMIPPAHNMEVGLSRCTSASSSVTYAQYLDPDQLSSDEQVADSFMNEELQSFETPWTDDKHSSYLSNMEATFVKNLYDRAYCAVDVCGQEPCCRDYVDPEMAESQPDFAFDNIEYKSPQSGDRRPNFFAKPAIHFSSPWSLLADPWVKPFPCQVPCDPESSSQKEIGFVSSEPQFEEGEITGHQRHSGILFPQESQVPLEKFVEMWLEGLPRLQPNSSGPSGVQTVKKCPNIPSIKDNDGKASTLKQ